MKPLGVGAPKRDVEGEAVWPGCGSPRTVGGGRSRSDCLASTQNVPNWGQCRVRDCFPCSLSTVAERLNLSATDMRLPRPLATVANAPGARRQRPREGAVPRAPFPKRHHPNGRAGCTRRIYPVKRNPSLNASTSKSNQGGRFILNRARLTSMILSGFASNTTRSTTDSAAPYASAAAARTMSPS